MTSRSSARVLLALAALLAATQAAAQGVVRGLVYDSLLGAPLGSADVWVRGGGSALHTLTDAHGRFALGGVPTGRYLLAATHAGLDSAGLYSVATPLAVAGGDTVEVTIATPSLATLWRRRCGAERPTGPDSGIVFGVVQDAATGAHLAGAAILATWVQLAPRGRSQVEVESRAVRVRTDSVGAFYACGISPEMTVAVRAYAGPDSSGRIDLRPSSRPVGRQDLTVALSPAGAAAVRPPAVLRGTVVGTDGRPVLGARVTVRESGSAVTGSSGGFVLAGLPAGTQWVSAQAIGRLPVEQAVDLRAGDTAAVSFTLALSPVTLAPVRVTGERSAVLAGIEQRRVLGQGWVRTEAELARIADMRSVFALAPSVIVGRARSVVDFVVLLPRPGAGGRGYCVAPLFIDGHRADYDQLASVRPSDLLAVEVYPRPATAPPEYQSVATGCGIVLVWMK